MTIIKIASSVCFISAKELYTGKSHLCVLTAWLKAVLLCTNLGEGCELRLGKLTSSLSCPKLSVPCRGPMLNIIPDNMQAYIYL